MKKLLEFIVLASITTLLLAVSLHVYEFISTGTLVVLVTLSVVFGLSSILKL